ncbi:uncharacterized protein (DUF1015 family) [Saccharopolyspora erythraea NRRL 2338]|uniref:Uncharacterized conserved protein UCP033563 n=2 Tax=Saccharopolyspora erythraea TaxID=1836 RepID=A4FHH1_SACEN|nr:DUF1015 family protein [Saccharopolyspora erythraea]EQD81699.1 hypothetical protein N599_34680 [Saccharopolyspora erythraea D]PFG97191.1 uncharacterized protein (DUF1015 family) [Saccharopolyspora erythraea NRRL 2338]QRK87392.1 DUF1015 domain-containing protein [Saccharopolyspora erythraea]CAM03496.1 uncharacterised conserved protein UCP033563 [Saccharopolyspora erythraea NRRL 2338]
MSAYPVRQAAPAEHRGITLRPPRMRLSGPHGAATRLPAPAIVVYRLESGQHRQTGVVVEVSVDDYRDGRIRRHEDTRPDHVRQIAELTESTGTEQTPVMLVHRGRGVLRARLAAITAGEPDVRVLRDGVAHSVWIRRSAELARELADEAGRIDALYIADGHHRMAAAERYADRRRQLGQDHAFTLAALFPGDEARILGYHRCFALAERATAQDVLDRLAAHPGTARIEESAAGATAPGVVAVGLGDRWYRLVLRPRDHRSLDAFTVDDELVPTLSGLTDQAGTTAGSHHAMETCWCAGRNAVRLVPHPPTIEQLMATSDAGVPMPPKSTCFDPKPMSGLFVRELT